MTPERWLLIPILYLSIDGESTHLQPLPHSVAVLLLRHVALLQHQELANELVGVLNLQMTEQKLDYVIAALLQSLDASRADSRNLAMRKITRATYTTKITGDLLIDEFAQRLSSNLAVVRVETAFHDNDDITKEIMKGKRLLFFTDYLNWISLNAF